MTNNDLIKSLLKRNVKIVLCNLKKYCEENGDIDVGIRKLYMEFKKEGYERIGYVNLQRTLKTLRELGLISGSYRNYKLNEEEIKKLFE